MMHPEDFQQAVDAFRQRQPFQPFVIELESGERLIIRDLAEISCCFGAADYEAPDGELFFIDSYDVLQVCDLAPQEAPPP